MRTPVVLCLALLVAAAGPAFAMGEEWFGNADILGEYPEFPGVVDLVNHSSRVYATWVNGNTHYYFDADAGQINALLKEFGEVDIAPREVVLRPGAGETGSFSAVDEHGKVVMESKRIDYSADLHIVQGIADLLGGERPPALTVFVNDTAMLGALQVPQGVRVVAPSEIRARLLEKLHSQNREQCGYAAFDLAETEPYTADNVAAIAALLMDDDKWVRGMAATALRRLGSHAQEALPALRAALELTPDDKSIARTIEAVGQPADHTLSTEEQKILLAIEAYCQEHTPAVPSR